MTATSRSTASVRGVDLVYDLRGNGPDLVWGHGLTSSMTAEDEFGLLDWSRLRLGHRVLRYDARGHGGSASSPEPETHHWRELARDQLALADHLGIGRYVAAGASMGSATALHAAVLAPDRLRALVLVVPPTAWSTRAAQTDVYVAMADLVEAGDHATLLRAAATTPPPDPFVDDQRWRERFPEVLRTSDPIELACVLRGAARADLPAPDQVAAIGLPTLILAWTGDPGHPATTAARLQELMPHAELALATTPTGVAAWTERLVAFLGSLP